MNRTGIGYDVHRFAAGRALVLGGVEIPHPVGLLGHSDADVLCHAIADALLGAAGQPDIGHLFPNSDPAISGICSLRILERVRGILSESSFEICNVDATVIAEAPILSPHLPAMRARISAALGIAPGQVGIKATTNEGLGFLGRSEGIAAMAVASLQQNS